MHKSNTPSLTLSLILHVIIFVLLALIFYSQPARLSFSDQEAAGGIVLTSRDQVTKKDDYLDQQDLENQLQSASTPAAAAANAPPIPAPELTVPQPVAPGVGLQVPPTLDANAMTEISRGGLDLQPEPNQALQDLLDAEAALARSRAPAGPATSLSVFGGGKMSGRSFLFLLDRSKSMGSGGLGVLQAARGELSGAIDTLEPHHQFQIIGYHQQTTPMREQKLLQATPANQKAVPEFIGSLAAFGATDHLNALLVGVSYKPDVLVVMTDGGLPELNDAQLKTIRRLASGTEIHCLEFGFGSQQRPTDFLVKLAEQNAGSYRYVNVQDWQNE